MPPRTVKFRSDGAVSAQNCLCFKQVAMTVLKNTTPCCHSGGSRLPSLMANGRQDWGPRKYVCQIDGHTAIQAKYRTRVHRTVARTEPECPNINDTNRRRPPPPPPPSKRKSQTQLASPLPTLPSLHRLAPSSTPPLASLPFPPPPHGSAGSLGRLLLLRRRHVRGGGEPGARRPARPLRQGHPEGAA